MLLRRIAETGGTVDDFAEEILPLARAMKRGWSYLDSPFMATGSMTTAGIACLAICHYALLHPRKIPAYKPSLQGQVARAIQDGFSWLDIHFTVTHNPPARAPA